MKLFDHCHPKFKWVLDGFKGKLLISYEERGNFFLKEFHQIRFEISFNNTFLVLDLLVPRKCLGGGGSGRWILITFKHIHLVQSLYKLPAKVFSNELKRSLARWFQKLRFHL